MLFFSRVPAIATVLFVMSYWPGCLCVAQDAGTVTRQAVEKVQAAVVRLRVIGGQQVVDGEAVNSLVTTGLVISEAGEILTSSFALQGTPDAVLVEKPDGSRVNARIVATDHVRRIVLLRAEGSGWVPAKVAARDAIQVGQYSIALGRFYQSTAPSVSVGIVSALNRIHGMAIQTDARISPVNYGGPLIGLSGEVYGILVPLSPRGRGNASSGLEWYDSGIGFAIPMQDALKIAERLRAGEDLHPGLLGLILASKGAFSSRVTVGRVLPGGPADQAGLQEGDRLLKINDRPVDRIAVPEEVIAACYSGEDIRLNVMRGEQTLDVSLTLAESLPEVIPGYLGVLTVGSAAGKPAAGPAVEVPGIPGGIRLDGVADAAAKKGGVRLLVIPDGVIGKAGVPAQIEVMSVNGLRVTSESSLFRLTPKLISGAGVKLTYRVMGSDEEKSLEILAGQRPLTVPSVSEALLSQWEALAQAIAGSSEKSEETAEAAVGIQRSDVEIEGRGRCITLTPAGPSKRSSAPVILLSEHATSEDAILNRWKPFLESHRIQIIIPVNPDKSALTDADVPLVLSCIQQVSSAAAVDLRRTVLVASRDQAALAKQLAFDGPSGIRGVVLTTGWFSGTELEGISGLGASVMLLDTDTNAASQALKSESSQFLKKSGFWVPESRPDVSSEQNIADFSLLLRSL